MTTSGLVAVTPEMVNAGVEELFDHRFGEDWRLVLEDVYRAMRYAELRHAKKATLSDDGPGSD